MAVSLLPNSWRPRGEPLRFRKQHKRAQLRYLPVRPLERQNSSSPQKGGVLPLDPYLCLGCKSQYGWKMRRPSRPSLFLVGAVLESV